MVSQQSVGKAAWLWGAIFGFVTFGINYAVGMVLFQILIHSDLSLNSFNLISMTRSLVISVVGYFVAALLAGRQARSIVAGTFAGLIAAAIQNIVGIIVEYISLREQNFPSQAVANTIITNAIITDIVFLVISLGLGAGIGALGGLAGRSSAGGNMQVTGGYPPTGYYPGAMPPYASPGGPYPQAPYPLPTGPYPQGPASPPTQPPYPYQQPPPASSPLQVSVPDTYQIAKLYDGLDPQTKQPFFSAQHPRITDVAECERLITFLKEGVVVLRMMGFTEDVLDPQHPKRVPVAYRTDGKWLWDDGTTYYLQTYNLAPDPAFYQYIVNCNYQCQQPTDAEADAALQWFLKQAHS